MGVILLTAEQLSEIIAGAVAQGVEQGLLRAKPMLQAEELVGEDEAMKLAGYNDRQSFRAWRKANGITPEVKARRNYYQPSQLRAASITKGVHTK